MTQGRDTVNALTADPSSWADSQAFELDYWKNHWPFRDKSVPELQQHRHRVGEWLLENTGFAKDAAGRFPAFKGRVLEVGCGPIGFFELFQDVQVDAIDSLMAAYAREIPYATLGRRGASTYAATDLAKTGGNYDFVVCSNVLDHTADWMAFLQDLVAAARGGGGELLLYTDFRGAPAVGHTQVYTPDQVRRALTWQGLTVTEYKLLPGNDHCDGSAFIRARR